MTDVLTPEQRRTNMSRIRGKDTLPEMLLRRGLHALGFRYSLHRRDMPGCPDIVLRRYKAVIFVNGCFWHGHQCHLFVMPKTRTQFWRQKISRNVERDKEAVAALGGSGWRVVTLWECALRGKHKLPFENLLKTTQRFLRGTGTILQLPALVANENREDFPRAQYRVPTVIHRKSG